MSIPLVRNNTKDAINTSIIAIKKNLERINSLLGLMDSNEPDLSGLATKQELKDAVTEINNTIDEVETSLQPVNTVTSGDMHSVTSNAVANSFGTWETLWSSGYSIIKGIVCNGKAFVTIHLQGFVCSSNDYLITIIAEKYRPQTVSRGFCFSAENPLLMGYINIETNGNVSINGMNGKTVYGDSIIMIEKDV